MSEAAAPARQTLHALHGQIIRVQTGDATMAAAATEALGDVAPAGEPAEPVLEVLLHAVGEAGQLPRPSPAARFVASVPQVPGSAACSLPRDGGRWLIAFEKTGLFSLDLAAGRVEGWLVEPHRLPPDGAASFVLLAAIELLRTRGVYAVHGAALECDGRGVLIVGPSGSGKTTACLALARAGYQCLSDDHPLLRWRNGEPELLAFPGRISATDRTIAWFPELQAAQDRFRRDSRKRSFELREIGGYAPVGGVCRPEALLFPRITGCARSVLEPLSKARALEELLPQTLLVMDPQLAARQFQTMASLVRATPAYRLRFGEDPARLPELVDPLLRTAAAG